ncbi:carbamoyl-phosphate synthase subunit L [Rubrivivax sp. JA1029]|uniref:acetyl/propionyl/methylcrotonyl-CoA carboxylase subunit alpha n=1 Tax=Rubrivivax sp. JA1029 TaxID=2894193 RepID=UPI001E5FACAD|nr:biotin carboxylase N-terminal domain-containing protein [Rubrivivax sp. JA1029]MCC9645686.1 carbamoyl-phosphate synthase subunit L [Rubrivivax sp. JA1029]
MSRPFETVLVANRGEIACRVMRTARRLGYRTVAVYSDADAAAPHVRQADVAVRLGPGPASESYLNVAAVLDAARRSGADAVHPGYGFLSERADFAAAVEAAGLVFIGPPAEAIRAMGDKAGAKRRMLAAGVPCAPGYLGDDQSDERLAAEAEALGLPLLVKAVAGGGGRGMRLVRQPGELVAALAGARREAESAFGDGRLMLERLITGARHVEVQVFADAHGRAVHLGERDCTAQRRRQKVVEEAPSPIVGAGMRATMGRDAVAAALAVGYRGAGTVEFVVDAEGRHFFLEMNTRLQVEHPATEAITGLDLVEWQLRIAAGEPLPLTQQQIRFDGHAIEARLYAEDPYAGWTPQTGRVLRWRPADAGIRVDHGLAEGGEVPPYYDAMVAKFVAHGRDRTDALRRLRRALADAVLVGPRHNARFLRELLAHPDFTGARMTTTRLDEWAAAGEPLLRRPQPPEAVWQLAAALLGGSGSLGSLGSGLTRPDPGSVARPDPGSVGGAGSLGSGLTRPDPALRDPALRAPALRPPPALRPAGLARLDLVVDCAGERRTLRAPPDEVRVLELDADGRVRWWHDGMQRQAVALRDGDTLHLVVDGDVFAFAEASPWPGTDTASDASCARAPVAGVVAQVLVAPGDRVEAGQRLACVEAMKMEMWLEAGAAGLVRAVHAAAKDPVAAGALLVELELDA